MYTRPETYQEACTKYYWKDVPKLEYQMLHWNLHGCGKHYMWVFRPYGYRHSKPCVNNPVIQVQTKADDMVVALRHHELNGPDRFRILVRK